MELQKSCKRSTEKVGNKEFRKLSDEVGDTVAPYSNMDLSVEILLNREKSKSWLVKATAYTSAALIAVVTFFAVITHDREILFVVLDFLGCAVSALLAWALGMRMARRRPESRSRDDEENEDSGREEDPLDS